MGKGLIWKLGKQLFWHEFWVVWTIENFQEQMSTFQNAIVSYGELHYSCSKRIPVFLVFFPRAPVLVCERSGRCPQGRRCPGLHRAHVSTAAAWSPQRLYFVTCTHQLCVVPFRKSPQGDGGLSAEALPGRSAPEQGAEAGEIPCWGQAAGRGHFHLLR